MALGVGPISSGAISSRPSGAATQTLLPSLVTNSQTFFVPTVTPGAVTLSPSLVTNSQTFYAPTVTPGAVALTPNLFTNSNSFFAPTVTPGAVTLSPSLVTNSQTFYAPTVTPGAVTLLPSLITNGQTFYSPVVTQDGGTQFLLPSLVKNDQIFYAPTVLASTTDSSPIRNFSLKEWRKWRRPQDDEELARRGLDAESAEIIDDVALRQAEDTRLDEQQKLDELRGELRLRRIELKTAHIEALNERRAEILREEIGRLLRLRMQNEEDTIILLMLAEAVA